MYRYIRRLYNTNRSKIQYQPSIKKIDIYNSNRKLKQLENEMDIIIEKQNNYDDHLNNLIHFMIGICIIGPIVCIPIRMFT